MTADLRIEAAIKAGCDSGLPPGKCVYPECQCRMPLRIKSALAAADAASLQGAEEVDGWLEHAATGLESIDFHAAKVRQAAALIQAQRARIAELEAVLLRWQQMNASASRSRKTETVFVDVRDWEIEQAKTRAALAGTPK